MTTKGASAFQKEIGKERAFLAQGKMKVNLWWCWSSLEAKCLVFELSSRGRQNTAQTPVLISILKQLNCQKTIKSPARPGDGCCSQRGPVAVGGPWGTFCFKMIFFFIYSFFLRGENEILNLQKYINECDGIVSVKFRDLVLVCDVPMLYFHLDRVDWKGYIEVTVVHRSTWAILETVNQEWKW